MSWIIVVEQRDLKVRYIIKCRYTTIVVVMRRPTPLEMQEVPLTGGIPHKG
jgi:hypothetical protein